MAYFPNGTAGTVLDNQCVDCIHADPDVMCPIAYVQMDFNYEQNKKGNEALKIAMSRLVDDKGHCNMKPLIDSLGIVNPNKKCFQRKLKFGDEEQIAALNG